MKPSVRRSVCRLVDLSVGWSVGQVVGWSVGWSVGRYGGNGVVNFFEKILDIWAKLLIRSWQIDIEDDLKDHRPPCPAVGWSVGCWGIT